jgi:hypothetical protein
MDKTEYTDKHRRNFQYVHYCKEWISPIKRPVCELNRDVMWLNFTLFNQSALFTVIRELEYALLQLTHEVDELLMAV